MKKKIVSICLLLSLCLSLCFGTMPTYASGDSIFLSSNYVYQYKSNWCWAASAENAIRWEGGLVRNQSVAVNHFYGTDSDAFPDYIGDIFDSANAAAFMSNYTHSYNAYECSFSDWFLHMQLSYSHPIICAGGYYNYLGERLWGHAVLVCGWYDGSYQSPILIYYDSEIPGYRTCSYAEFCNGSFNNKIYDQTCYHS